MASPDPPHEADLEFEYGDERRARTVAASVSQEVGEIDGDRSATAVKREDATVVVTVSADDLVALRAGLNTWLSLVDVAERAARTK